MRIKSLMTILFFSAMLLSCKKQLKDPMDYYPKIETVSASVNQDGSVTVVGSVISEGASPIDYMGFCVKSGGIPQMLDRQKISNSSFSVTYTGFSPNSTYYFRSWAANEYGYTMGNSISINNITPAPVVAPCSLATNYLNIGGGQPNDSYYSVSTPSSSWVIDAYGTSTTVSFHFGENPQNKIYKTTTISPPPPNEVFVSFYSGFISGVLSDGSDVYVNKTGANTWEITICNAPWIYNSSTFYFKTNLIAPQ